LFHGWDDNLLGVLWTTTNNGGNYWIDSSTQALNAFTTAGQDFS